MGLFSKLFGIGSNESSRVEQNVKIAAPVKVETYEKYEPDIPSVQGDYAKAIFLWAHKRACPIKKSSEYQRYLLYECGIRDANAYHRELLQQGYFEEASNKTILESLKVTELKQILSELGQSVTGKKETLIERILAFGDEAIIKRASGVTLYSLTEKAIQFLEDKEAYVRIHQHGRWGINWKEYDARYKEGMTFNDVVWGIFNERILKDTHNYGRNEYYNMYELLEEENRREQALYTLMRVLYLDLSGIGILDSIKLFQGGVYAKKDLKELFSIAIMLAPGVINPIANYRDVYSDAMVDKLYEQKLPIQICTKSKFCSIIQSIFDDTYDEAKIHSDLRKSYCEFIDAM